MLPAWGCSAGALSSLGRYFDRAMYSVTRAQVCESGEKLVQVIVGRLFRPENPGVWKNTVPSSMKVAAWRRRPAAVLPDTSDE